jgi:hypothetical protein
MRPPPVFDMTPRWACRSFGNSRVQQGRRWSLGFSGHIITRIRNTGLECKVCNLVQDFRAFSKSAFVLSDASPIVPKALPASRRRLMTPIMLAKLMWRCEKSSSRSHSDCNSSSQSSACLHARHALWNCTPASRSLWSVSHESLDKGSKSYTPELVEAMHPTSML